MTCAAILFNCFGSRVYCITDCRFVTFPMHHHFIDRFSLGDSPAHRLDARAKLVAVLGYMAVLISFDRYAVASLAPMASCRWRCSGSAACRSGLPCGGWRFSARSS